MDWHGGYDWLHLILRWFHVMGAISWVGSSLYFMWLGRVFDGAEPDMIRATGAAPKIAHWFMRETTLTWVSGALLLVLVYFSSSLAAFGNGVLTLVLLAVGWVVYDRLWLRNAIVATVVSLLLVALLAWGLGAFYGGRLVYVQVGALLGTLMAGNVWLRLLPALRAPDDEGAWAVARQRSEHNSYLIFPTVALMLSNHVPAIYESTPGAAMLVLLIVAFIAARHVVVGGRARKWVLGGMLLLLAAMIAMTGR